MSIYRSGLASTVYVVCLSELKIGELIIKKGEKCELVQDIGSMYVIKTPKGEETVVPKDAFADEA